MRVALPVVLPSLVLALPPAVLLGTWLLDDSGISMAWALTLFEAGQAAGQPGGEVVEGYSNPLWVALMAGPLAVSRAPVLVAKALGGLCWLGAVLLLERGLRRALPHPLHRAAALLALALHPSVLAWSLSGMENGLTALLCAAAALYSQLCDRDDAASTRTHMTTGSLVGLLAWCRPELLLLGPAAVLGGIRHGPRRAAGLLLGWSIPVVLLFAHRLALYGAWWPHTREVKGGEELGRLVALLTLDGPMLAHLASLPASLLPGTVELLGTWAPPVAGTALLLAALALSRRPTHPELPPVSPLSAALALAALLAWTLMPADHYGPYRYATPVVLLCLPLLLGAARRRLGDRAVARLTPALAIASISANTLATNRVCLDPPVPLQTVYGEHAVVSAVFEGSGLPEPSRATPDIGAPLLYSRACVHDLGLLASMDLATAVADGQTGALLAEELRPGLVDTHKEWTALHRLSLDSAFSAGWMPVLTWPDAWASRRAGVTVESGTWLRRDLALAHPDLSGDLAHELASLGDRDAPVPSWELAALPPVPRDRGCPGEGAP